MTSEVAALVDFLAARRRLFVLTGAGCSTASGIPDYRDEAGAWKHRQPMTLQRFLGRREARRRYWAGSLVGWRRIAAARPNPAHDALAELERRGALGVLVTQNVDGLHQRAGHQRVIDLHGRLDQVRCLGDCGGRLSRAAFQEELAADNPWFAEEMAAAGRLRPDGDVAVDGIDLERFVVPDCPHCGGLLKPDVVFFGERVPPARVEAAWQGLAEADGVLVVGSSLMVWSGYRFVVDAARRGLPVAAVNLGRTRADDLLSLKVTAPCGTVLDAVCRALEACLPDRAQGERRWLGPGVDHGAGDRGAGGDVEAATRRSMGE